MNPEHITLFCLGVFLIATYFIAKSVHNYFDHYLWTKKKETIQKHEIEMVNKALGMKSGDVIKFPRGPA